MKRIFLHLAMSLLAFGLGLAVSSAWRFFTSADTPEPFIPAFQQEIPSVPSAPLRIEGIVLGAGPQTTTHSYYLSNGAEITRICEHFTSAEDANLVFRARRPAGGEIIQWITNLDNNSGQIGEMVLYVSNGTAVRLSTRGSTLCETRSSSLGNLRWLEEYESQDLH